MWVITIARAEKVWAKIQNKFETYKNMSQKTENFLNQDEVQKYIYIYIQIVVKSV